MIVEHSEFRRGQSKPSSCDLASDVPVNSKTMFIELWNATALQNILEDKCSRTFRTLYVSCHKSLKIYLV